MEAKLSRGDMIKWAFNITLPLIIFLIPCNEVFTMQLKLFFTSTMFAILCFAFGTMNQTVVSLALPLFWVFTKVTEPTVAFQPWTQYVPWMMMTGLLLANTLESSGLLARISYWCIEKTGGTYAGMIWGVALASGFLTIFSGNVVVPVAALTYGLCIALNTGLTKASAGIMMTGAMGCQVLQPIKMQGPLLMMGIGEPITGPLEFLGFFESLWVNAPILLEYVLMVFFITIFFKPDKPIGGKEYFRQKLNEMGKITAREIKCATVLILFLVYILTKDIHGWSIQWGLAILPLLLCMPVIGSATDADVKKLNYGLIFFITACMGIGAVAGALGIGKILVDMVMPYLQGQSHYVFFLIEWFMLVILNFVMTPLAMEAAFTIPFATLGTAMGLDPMAIYYFMGSAVDQVIMPYQNALYLIFFGFGAMRVNDFMKIMSVKMGLNFIIMFAMLLPWWNFLGFLFK
ncbi:MAG: SLC13 family permease [Peptococcaceae bacterium]